MCRFIFRFAVNTLWHIGQERSSTGTLNRGRVSATGPISLGMIEIVECAVETRRAEESITLTHATLLTHPLSLPLPPSLSLSLTSSLPPAGAR
eukprot:m.255205 g.255205  ORF g.255205 m.255205 type:complete len:93 (+) comp26547_c1_seq3:2815-3093(+)